MHIKQLGQSEPSSAAASTPDWVIRIDIMRSLRLHKMLATLIALLAIGVGIAVQGSASCYAMKQAAWSTYRQISRPH